MYLHHHFVFCLTSPLPLLQRILHRVRSSAASPNFQYLLFSLRSTVGAHIYFLVFPSLVSSIWPPITCFIRRFLLKARPIHLAVLRFIICRLLLSSLSLRNESLFFTWWVQLIIPAFSSKIFQYFAGIYELLSEVSDFSSIENYASYLAFQCIFIYASSN
jgi:hypothetical protein